MDLSGGMIVVDGRFVSQKVANVIQAIKEYDPDIDVEWVPPEVRERGRAAYRIVHRPPNAEEYVMFHVRRDEDMDERILHKIIANDQRNGQQTLSDFDAWEESQRLVARQRYNDLMEEAHDMAYHALKTNKNVYKINDDITIRDRGGLI